MSIYDVLSFENPVLAYSVLHQPRKTVTAKEYAKSLTVFRSELIDESEKSKAAWQSYVSELTAKTVQTTSGNLSQFLSTPIQSDAGEIQHILTDQFSQIIDQLLPKTNDGPMDGCDGRFITETPQVEIPKGKATGGRTFFQNMGIKIGRNNSSVFESLYVFQGSLNLDILEQIVRHRIGIYHSSHGTKVNQSLIFASSLYNRLLLDGTMERNNDRFELHVRFEKGKEPYDLFNKELIEQAKVFRLEVHDLNVSVWQKKLGLGAREEYILRVRSKDRTNLRSAVSVLQEAAKGKGCIAGAFKSGVWLTKELF